MLAHHVVMAANPQKDAHPCLCRSEVTKVGEVDQLLKTKNGVGKCTKWQDKPSLGVPWQNCATMCRFGHEYVFVWLLQSMWCPRWTTS